MLYLAYAYVYEAENSFLGVIFDCEQDGREIFSKIELFGFLGIRFNSNFHVSNRKKRVNKRKVETMLVKRSSKIAKISIQMQET